MDYTTVNPQIELINIVILSIYNTIINVCHYNKQIIELLLNNENFIIIIKLQLKPNLNPNLDIMKNCFNLLYCMIDFGYLEKIIDIFIESIFLLINITNIKYSLIIFIYKCCLINPYYTLTKLSNYGSYLIHSFFYLFICINFVFICYLKNYFIECILFFDF